MFAPLLIAPYEHFATRRFVTRVANIAEASRRYATRESDTLVLRLGASDEKGIRSERTARISKRPLLRGGWQVLLHDPRRHERRTVRERRRGAFAPLAISHRQRH